MAAGIVDIDRPAGLKPRSSNWRRGRGRICNWPDSLELRPPRVARRFSRLAGPQKIKRSCGRPMKGSALQDQLKLARWLAYGSRLAQAEAGVQRASPSTATPKPSSSLTRRPSSLGRGMSSASRSPRDRRGPQRRRPGSPGTRHRGAALMTASVQHSTPSRTCAGAGQLCR